MDQSTPPTTAQRVVCPLSALAPGAMKAFTVDGTPVLLVRDPDGTVYATGNECTHAEAWLEDGELFPEEREIECPLHLGRFRYTDGQPTEDPCEIPLATYPVVVTGDQVVVDVSGRSS